MSTRNMEPTAHRHPRRRVVMSSRPDHSNSADSQSSNPGLKKGETFHPSTRPPTARDPVLNLPRLPRRSPTSPEALEAIAAGQQRMADIIDNLGLESLNLSDSADERDESPAPRSATKSSAEADESDKENTRSRPSSSTKLRRSSSHASDSGLGSSVSSVETACSTKDKVTSGPLAHDQTNVTKHTLSANGRLAIEGRILFPLLKEDKFRPYHTLVRRAHESMEKNQVSCLRDLEKIILMSAPDVKARVKTFFQFCQVTITCLFDTVPRLNERDQRMPTDRPYTNGYFLDLVSQINRFKSIRDSSRGIQLRAEGRKIGEKGDKSGSIMDLRLTLEGGYAKTGRPAELVAHRNGESISLRTGEIYDELLGPTMKRKGDDGVMRSMARRKKNAPPMDINKKCEFCDKIFQRPCDLTKHEKTHSRPFKCAEPSCKYHELGFPTEKETERHFNDKHCNTPLMYKCLFPSCSYQSKRQSNCKQHMEKTHKWKYVRSKNNGRIGKRPTPQRGSPRDSLHTHDDMASPMSKVADMDTPETGASSSPEPMGGYPHNMPFSFADPPMPTQTEDFQLFSNGSSVGGSPCALSDYRPLPSASTSFDHAQPQMPLVGSPASGSVDFLTPATGTTQSPYEPVSTYPENSMFSFADPFTQVKPEDSLMFVNNGFGEMPSMFDDPLAFHDPSYETTMEFDGLPAQLDMDSNIVYMDPWDEFFNRGTDHHASM